MAIAQKHNGVTRGYKSKTQRVARREPGLRARAWATCRIGARELRALVADEIICATIDTVRVLDFLRVGLGWRTRSHVETLRAAEPLGYEHELARENARIGMERAGVMAE